MATEFIVKLKDRPGSLAAAAQALADGGVNLWGTAASTSAGKGTVGFVVKDKDATKARRALKKAARREGRREIDVKMTLTAPGCGMGEILVDDVRSKLEMIPTVAEADVDLVFDPPWNQHMMSEAARLETGML